MNFLVITLVVIGFLLAGSLVRVFVGPTVWDRVLGLNLVTAKLVMAIVVFAFLVDRTFLLDVAIVYSLLGFIASVLISRFIEGKGQV